MATPIIEIVSLHDDWVYIVLQLCRPTLVRRRSVLMFVMLIDLGVLTNGYLAGFSEDRRCDCEAISLCLGIMDAYDLKLMNDKLTSVHADKCSDF